MSNNFESEPLPKDDDILQAAALQPAPAGEVVQPVGDLPEQPAAGAATAATAEEPVEDDELLVNRNGAAAAPRQTRRAPVRPYTPLIFHPNVEVKDQPLKRAEHAADDGLLMAPSTPDDITNILAGIDGETLGTGNDVHEWLGRLDESTLVSIPGDTVMRVQMREGSMWAQELQGAKYFIKPAYKKTAPSDVKSEMSGNTAVDMFIANTGMGRPVRWPLYRSGIWINIRPASLTYLAEIDRSLSFERAQLGMDTAGLLNSNDGLIFDEKLVDAALRLVTRCSVNVTSTMDLRDLIVKSDIPSLIAAMAAATYADGAVGSIPCTTVECKHVDTFDMDVRRMSWVDQARFSKEQVNFMDDPDAIHTIEEVRKYQEGFLRDEEGNFVYKGRIFDFHVGSAQQYFTLGHQWFAQINRALNEALGEAEIENGRRARITQSILTAETLCRYAHYIKSIRIPGKDENQNDVMSTITDADTIRDILKMLLSDDDGADGLLAAIDNYMVQTEVVIIGYPNVKCSKCNTYHLDDRGEARLIIPYKVGSAFFIQLQRKLLSSAIPPMTDLETSGIRAFAAAVSDQESRNLLMQLQQQGQLQQQ